MVDSRQHLQQRVGLRATRYAHMKLETTLRHIRVAEFTAEALEREADAMPPSYQDRANHLRQYAKALRLDSVLPEAADSLYRRPAHTSSRPRGL